MRFDYENQICENQAFTGAATVSDDSFKKASAAQDISIGRRMALLVMSGDTEIGDETADHVLEVIQADDADLTTNVEVLASVTVKGALLLKGQEVELPIPQGVMSREYLGFRHSATGGSDQTATLDVYVVPQDEIPKYKSFPKVNHSLA